MNIEFIIRIFVAAILGGIIGLEREYRAKEAGFRTHFLVSMGSALFMILSQYGFGDILSELNKASFDPSRIASQVVTGIGFIGAGTIIFQKHMVKGLTTAAGLWVTSAIGLTTGAGMYILSVAATILVLVCLEAMTFFLNEFGTKSIAVTFSSRNRENIRTVIESIIAEDINMDSYEMKEQQVDNRTQYIVNMEIKIKRADYKTRIKYFMKDFDGVSIESIE